MRRIPVAAWLAAIAAAGLHLWPLVWSVAATPDGWHFTGNLRATNPDFMQYRVWFRQTQVDGPIVSNVLTSEPNGRHLVLFFQYAVGKVASVTGVPPEFIYEYIGVVLIVVFVVVLYLIVAGLFTETSQRWWVFLALILGGGLGAHLKFLLRFESIRDFAPVRVLLWDAVNQWLLFEDYRGHFVFTTFFDTHFLVNWTLVTICVLVLAAWIRRPGAWRAGMVVAMSGLLGVLRLYEGITLVAIAAGIAGVCWARRTSAKPALAGLAMILATVLVCVAWQYTLQRSSGLPMPDWRGIVILPTILFLAYPLAWTLLVWGWPRLWREASLEVVVLLGWALGCTALTLSGPFYPYPDRGTVTLQIPITILAGLAYFRVRPRVSWRAAAVAVFLLGATPGWSVLRTAGNLGFRDDAPTIYQNAAHRQVIETLRTLATSDDVLLADARSVLWLAPEYPGRHYAAHFFLTVDFERKRREVEDFYRADSVAQAAFLQRHGIRFLFVSARENPSRYSAVPGLTPVVATSVGTLFAAY